MRRGGVAMQTNSLSVSALSNELSIVFYRGVVQLVDGLIFKTKFWSKIKINFI